MTLRKRRAAFALLVAAVLLALTWWRSPVSLAPSQDFTVEALDLPEPHGGASPLAVAAIWDIQGSGAGFGGFSALIAMPDNQLRAFSDRGWRFTFTMSEHGPGAMETAQVIPADGYQSALFDIEAATEAKDGTAYWLGYEANHAIHRFDAQDGADAVRSLKDEVSWPANTGMEALTLLADGRFLAFPETAESGVLFATDPANGAEMTEFTVSWPRADFSPTDSAQLPDGRVLVLMRRFSMAPLPTFESLLVIGEPPQAGADWEPVLLAELDEIIPSENYEGLAVRSLPDGSSELWLISDDNFSAFQRTLLVRLTFAASV